MKVNTFAFEEKDVNKNLIDDTSSISSKIDFMENILDENNISVVIELENCINRYENLLLNIEDKETYQKVEALIETTNDLIDDYRMFKEKNTRGAYHPVYSVIVAQAIGFFERSNYYLSCELLTHARDNLSLDSIYYPIYGYEVLSSSTYQSILNSSTLYGASIFQKTEDTLDNDLYYAIKAFNYSKSESGRVVVIQDRYDFQDYSSYDNIEEFLVDLIYEAQENNVIYPFYSVIKNDHNGTPTNQNKYLQFSHSTKYYEDKVTLAQGESKNYYITFDTDGIRTIQTFGMMDTIIYVYDNNDFYVIGSDDGGYLQNAFISYNFSANIQYRILVYFYDSSVSGETKLAITPASGDLKNGINNLNYYSDIYNFNINYTTYFTGFTQYKTKMVTFTPETSAVFNIYTTGTIDTYIYLIDPKSTYYRPDLENDDGGENYNARISTRLARNVDYLIIFSHYNLNSGNSSFNLVTDIS